MVWPLSSITSQIHGHVIGADMVPSLSSTFARALRASAGVPTSMPDRRYGRGRSHTSGSSQDNTARTTDIVNIVVVLTIMFGRPEWVQQASAANSTSDTATLELIVILLDEYKHYLQFWTSQTSTVTASHVSTAGTRACLASKNSSWIIDSRATTHITGNRDLFSILSQLLLLPVEFNGWGWLASSYLPLDNVLCLRFSC